MTTNSSTALAAVDLHKTYSGGRGKPRVAALDGLTCSAEPGTIFGLLGPNGAGKSTAVKILATLTRPDSGTAVIAGMDVVRRPDQVRRRIGFVAQQPVADPAATGRENLLLAGRLQGLTRRETRARAVELLDRFGLAEAARRLVRTYSGGMARKLDVAIGLMHRPSVLFLDEPTTGLDPEARSEMWAELEAMAAVEQMTVLLTTHYLEEADRLASSLAIVDHGRVVVAGTPDELKRALHGDALVVEVDTDEAVGAAVRSGERVPGLRDITAEGHTIRARADNGAIALPQLLTVLDGAAVHVTSATIARPNLDDVYLRHTGRSFDRAEAAA